MSTLPSGSFENSYCGYTLSPCFLAHGTDSCSKPLADPRTREPFKTIQSSSPNLQKVKPNLKEVGHFAQIYRARVSPDGQLSLPAQKWMSLIKQKESLVRRPAPPTPQNTQPCSLIVLSGEKRTFLAVLWNSFGAKLLKTDVCTVFTGCWPRQLVGPGTFRSLMGTVWEDPGVCSLFCSVWPSAQILIPALPLSVSSSKTEDAQGCVVLYTGTFWSGASKQWENRHFIAFASKGLFIFLVLHKNNAQKIWMEIKIKISP